MSLRNQLMRYIYLLLITFIFVSCGNQKMRFVRSETIKKQEIVTLEKSELSTDKKVASEPSKLKENKGKPSTVNQEVNSERSEDQVVTGNYSEQQVESLPEIVDDTVTVTSSERAEINQIAKKAETSGTFALLFGALSPIVLVITAVTALIFWEEIIVIAGLVASLIFTIAAIIFAIVSLSSKYNTKRGRHSSIIGLVWAIPFFILTSIILGLIITN